MKKNPVLIFDFDGTIADTFHYLLKIGNRLSEEFHFNKIHPDEVNDMKDKSVHETIQHLNIPLLKVPMIVAKAKKELHKEIASVEPIEGLKEILLQLKSLGHKMGILTSNSSKNVMDFLKHNELDLFDFIGTTSKIWSKNWGLKTLMEDNGLTLSEVIYIGDETRDIKAAKKAGVRSAAVTWGYNSRKVLEAQNPDYLIHTPQELFKLFA
jgi:HAD superfamily hydrolase (TIGR01549 family)